MSRVKTTVPAYKFDGSDYCKTVVEAIGCITSPDGKEQIDFRDIFYPVSIADGSYAIKNYSEVMAYVSTSKSFITKRDKIMSVRRNISEIMKKNNLTDAALSIDDSDDVGYYIRRQMVDEVYRRIEKSKKKPARVSIPIAARAQAVAGEKTAEGAKTKSGDIAQGESDKKAEVQISEAEKLRTDDDFTQGQLTRDDTPDWETADGLSVFEERDGVLASHIIFSHKKYSRTLLLASAGQGKSTVLRRIMLYYSQKNCGCFCGDDSDMIFKNKYYLPDTQYVPFLVKLREVSSDEQSFDIEKLIINSVMFYIHNSPQYAEQDDEPLKKAVTEWFYSLKEKDTPVLLLIDGLDEISDKNKIVFLESLDKYLRANEDTRIILSTRVAGIKSKKIMRAFTEMNFSYRSILPFTLEDTRKYADNWVEKTQKPELWERYKTALEQVFTNAKFLFLRNSMRSPLEVVIILKQIVSNSLSFSRYSVFRDMLWEYLTRHEPFESKNSVYEDRMTILSFLAYKMQINDTLLVSQQEIEEYFKTEENLSFHTDIIDNADTVGSVIKFLDDLASNASIVETQRVVKDDESGSVKKYTFPIRAFQEFLCAYACCHIRLTGERVPEPAKLLQQYIHDKKWNDIISFALSDTKRSNQQQYDLLVSNLITLLEESGDELQYLKSLLEAEMVLNKDHAFLMCEKYFSAISLSDSKREILDICLENESATAVLYHLKAKCKQAWKDKIENYFEAYARATVLWNFKIQSSVIEQAETFLCSNGAYLNKTGALMLVIAAEMVLEENDLRYNCLLDDEKVTKELCDSLSQKFFELEDTVFVQGLLSLWLLRLEGSEYAGEILDADKRYILSVREKLDKNAGNLVLLMSAKGKRITQNENFPWFKRLVYALGTYPYSRRFRTILWKRSQSPCYFLVSTFLEAMYKVCKNHNAYDRLTLIFAQMNYGMFTVEDFTDEIKTVVDLQRDILVVDKGKCQGKKNGFCAEKRTDNVFALLYEKYKEDGAFDTELYWKKFINTVYDCLSDQKREGKFEAALAECTTAIEKSKNPRISLISLMQAYVLLCKAKALGSADDTARRTISGVMGGSPENRKMATFMKICYYYFVEKDVDKAKSILASLDGDTKADEAREMTLDKLLEQLQREFPSDSFSTQTSGSSNKEKNSAVIEELFGGLDVEQMKFIKLLLTDEQFRQIKEIMAENMPVGGYKFNG